MKKLLISDSKVIRAIQGTLRAPICKIYFKDKASTNLYTIELGTNSYKSPVNTLHDDEQLIGVYGSYS